MTRAAPPGVPSPVRPAARPAGAWPAAVHPRGRPALAHVRRAALCFPVRTAALCLALACGGEPPPERGAEITEAGGGAATGGEAAGAAEAGDAAAPERRAAQPTEGRQGRIRVVDAAGRTWTFERPVHRVVSLVPSATASLRAMGAEDVLVGRTDFDTQEWARPLTSVGGGIEPNLEVVAALDPDLVVRFAGAQDPRTPERLDVLGIPHLAVRPDRIADIYATNTLLGEVTGRGEGADSLNRAIREGLRALAAATEALPPVRTAFVLGGSPPWVAGPATYVAEVIELAGGVNVFADLEKLYAAVSPEELRTRDVEVVLVSGRGTYDTSLTPGARIVEVGDALEVPGPDVVETARRVAALLHGEGTGGSEPVARRRDPSGAIGPRPTR